MIQLELRTPAQWKKTLVRRMQRAREVRRQKESQWDMNERTIFSTNGLTSPYLTQQGLTPQVITGGAPDAEVPANMGVNYSFKNLRFLHAQLSANPPTVIPRAATSDPEDKRRARCADAVCRYALRQYGLQEIFDQCSLNTLLYGTGLIKHLWDPDLGELLGRRPNGTLITEGDFLIRNVSPWKILIDPDADTIKEIRWVMEEMDVPAEDAFLRWPKRRKTLEKIINEDGEALDTPGKGGGDVLYSYLHGSDNKRESIRVVEYWETGTPANGYLGVYACFLEDGTFLDAPQPSSHAFSAPLNRMERESKKRGRKVKQGPLKASLPFSFFTDIDVPSSPWGKSFVEYEAPLQEIANRMDTVMLENFQAHGVARLILPDGCEVAEGSITNSPYDIVKIKGDSPGGQKPSFMDPMPMPASGPQLRQQIKDGIDDMAGVNESMFGVQSRETAGFAMQYATNQGNMIRRRLFNKYVGITEGVYRNVLDMARMEWDLERSVQVLGREKAFEVLDMKGEDIDGGYDLVVEYGTSLSLDPMTRRDDILKLQPIFEKANISPRTIAGMLKLGEIDDVDDEIRKAEDRQREVFDEIVESDTYIPPEPMMDHEGMIAWAMSYFMSAEFKYLNPREKMLLRKHVTDRAALAAKEKGPATPPAGAQPGGLPPGPAGTATPPAPSTDPTGVTPPGAPALQPG